ncbi:hypothetical protein JOF41_000757 [Saccharothrix coeruleofusca]|uniref:DUF3558 domain-containing protein n=1 Tax=Saccharothrix coeruleofusca TaxID=33919 RepID=UPI001AE0F32F|nr:DUF3558 domain-containing protein [Saccharothrix coeruleofusca]MBP2334579.1 hypothetical protein [Saccharothrix coeruleofusca]
MALITACTAEPGTPKAGSNASTGASTTTPTSAEPTSARPREIRLDGQDPCRLLTSEQLPALKIDREGRPRQSEAYQTTGCAWTVTGASNSLVPVTREGIEAWTGGKRTGKATAVEPVMGFPAITVTLESDSLSCDVMVDTAEGQYLAAAFTVSPSFQDRFPQPCAVARQLAEAAMQNLLK